MASTRYGAEFYGTVFYGADEVAEFVAPSFSVTANGYGRALVVWSRPGGAWTRQRLVRNLVGNPVDVLDGVLLIDQSYAEANREFQDEELVLGRNYYYGLFVLSQADGTWVRTGAAPVSVTRDFGYTKGLYYGLPEVFRVSDYNSLGSLALEEQDTYLYRWLSLIGLQLDHVRTELEGLRSANDPRVVASSLLPALASMVGVEYEPELGDRAVRRLTANAVRLSTVKGTLAGIREYATVFTGWGSDVRLGHNIALDRLNAGPDGGVGRWTGRQGCTTSYQAFTAATRGPAGEGAVLLTATASGAVMVADTNPAGSTDPLARLQYAVPVIAGLRFVVSQYARTTLAGLMASQGMTWLDAGGLPVGATSYGPPAALDDTWVGRPSHTLIAPVGARYLETGLRIDGAHTAGAVVRACGLQEQEGAVVKPWAPAREILIYLHGDLVNFVGNISGHGLSAEGWTGAVSQSELYDPTRFFLSFAPVVGRDPALEVLDALLVDYAGDVAPVVPADPPPGSYQGVYTAGTQLVVDRDVWSVLVDASGVYGERTMRVGFALFDGDVFIRYEWGPETAVGVDYELLTHELTVPDDADYDRVAFAVQSDDTVSAWRNAALEHEQLDDAKQFDGSTSDDYVWEGVPYRSTSHYYNHRAVRAVRLHELLADYVPHSASSRLVFAASSIPDSPRSSSGSDLDPDDSPVTTVGLRTRMRWKVATLVGANDSFTWEVFSRQIGVEYALGWNLEHIHRAPVLEWKTFELAGRDIEVQWSVSVVHVDLSTSWNLQEQVEPIEALIVD